MPSPMPKSHTSLENQQANATKIFDNYYKTIEDRLRMVSWSNYCHPGDVVKPFIRDPYHLTNQKAAVFQYTNVPFGFVILHPLKNGLDLFAIAAGWLLLDIGWLVLFLTLLVHFLFLLRDLFSTFKCRILFWYRFCLVTRLIIIFAY